MASKDGTQVQRPSNKRKGPPGAPSDAFRSKRQKTQRDARTLAVQTTSKAFSNGELDVGTFVKAREYEIRALEEGLARSKKSLTQRAFQQVPKELRRRTASHNAKRVPKRLRNQAEKEMADDNTPTVTSRRRKPTRHMRLRMETVKRLRSLGAKSKAAADGKGQDQKLRAAQASSNVGVVVTRAPRMKKNTLSAAPIPPSKFRKRQMHKTWLPTHIYHAKRAHMTPPREPLWRFSIPMTSTSKSYRPTHRASNERGAIAWDVSYMSCASLQGAESSIQRVLKGLSVGRPNDYSAPWGPKGSKWRNGSRIWQGWLYERDMYPSKPIAPATIIWQADESNSTCTQSMAKVNDSEASKAKNRLVLIRIHPSAFMQLWEQISSLAKMQRPPVVTEDLRFEIGSIEITGPGSTEALLGALQPTDATSPVAQQKSIQTTLSALAGVSNPGVLPPNCLLSFDITDPRLHHPPRTIDVNAQKDSSELYNILANWPSESTVESQGLFHRKIRNAASRALPTQKSINRRKGMAKAGAYPEPLATDPRIPVLMYPSSRAPSEKRSSSGRQASWTVLLPWKAVPAVWQSIMYYPLSTGGQVRLGGLQEKRQVEFESGSPWFPGDFHGTRAGREWEAGERLRRTKEWERRPKGKRTEWGSVALGPRRKGEIGNGLACDWAILVAGNAAAVGTSTTPGQEDAGDKFYHLPSTVTRSLLTGAPGPSSSDVDLSYGLATVRLVLLSRGVPSPCARIYRLPTDIDADASATAQGKSLRSKWLALSSAHAHGQSKEKAMKQRRPPLGIGKTLPQSAVEQHLAADLLQPPPGPENQKAENEHLEVPGADDMIGFVTTGEFCLTEGKGVAIGNILVRKVVDEARLGAVKGREGRHLCIVRNSGETIGRLAEWTVV